MAALESYRAELIKKSVAVFLADSCTGLTWLVLPLDNKAFTAPADLRYSPLLSGRGFFILYCAVNLLPASSSPGLAGMQLSLYSSG